MTIKNVEFCPGFGELAKGSAPYSGEKFGPPAADKRISDPIYDSEEKAQSTESDEPSEGTPTGIY